MHVPSAWLSLMTYIDDGGRRRGRPDLAHQGGACRGGEPARRHGAGFTAVSLVTGMMWGKPMWGTYWAWDPRLVCAADRCCSSFSATSGCAAPSMIATAPTGPARCWRSSASSMCPIVHYSVDWWNSLHQTPTVMKMRRALDAHAHAVAVAGHVPGLHVLLHRDHADAARAEVLRRERNARWVRDTVRRMSEFLAMSGYARIVWSSYAIALLASLCSISGWRVAGASHGAARKRAAALPLQENPHDPQKRRTFSWCGILAGVAVAARARAAGLQEQRDVLLRSHPGGHWRGADRAALPAGRHGREGTCSAGRQIEMRFVVTDFQHDVPVVYSASCPICSGRIRAWSPMASSARTACSSPMRCWPSTMRTTCRRKWPRHQGQARRRDAGESDHRPLRQPQLRPP